MAVYRVVFRPDTGGYWSITVRGNGVSGCVTQASSIDQGMKRAREALAACLERAEDADAAELVAEYRISVKARRSIARARQLQRRAELAQQSASEASRKVARELVANMSMRDAGVLLGISHPRVHQLVSEAPPDAGGRKRG